MTSDFIVKATTIFGVTFGVTLLSLVGCSQIYKRMLCQYKKDEIYHKHKTLDEFYKEYNHKYDICVTNENGEHRQVDECGEDKFDTLFVHESTPDGGVIMKYCKDDKLFLYWSDVNVKHRYLVTVARKFCKSYHCEHIYFLDTNEIYDKEEKNKSNNSDTSESENEDSKENDFLFLKKKELPRDNGNDADIDSDQNDNTKIKTSIRFRKTGLIRDFNILKHSTITESLTYKDFKIM